MSEQVFQFDVTLRLTRVSPEKEWPPRFVAFDLPGKPALTIEPSLPGPPNAEARRG